MNYKILMLSTLLGLSGLIQGCDAYRVKNNTNESRSIIKSPKDNRAYRAITLANKMEVILVEDSHSKVTAVSLAIAVGSYQNPPQQQGLAHYLEHAISLGTEKYPKPNTLKELIFRNSGKWNASTSRSHTQYFFSLPSSELDTALDIFSDFFKSPRFDPIASNKERNAIDSEWTMKRTNDFRIMQYLNGITGNPDHPARLLGVGNLETLADKEGSILNDELAAFFDRYYSANIMKLAMVSNLDLDQQEAQVRKHFESVRNKNIETPKIEAPGVTQAQMGKKIYYSPVTDLKFLNLSFPIPNNQHAWRSKPNEYLSALIASEEPGTVAQSLRSDKLIQYLSCSVAPQMYGHDGSFDIRVKLTNKGLSNRDEVIAAIFSYIQLIKDEGVKESYYLELKSIKERKLHNLSKGKPLKVATHLSKALLNYSPQWAIANPFIYEAFDPQAINSVLKNLSPERARIWYISQREQAKTPIPYHAGKYSINDITGADIRRWQELSSTMAFRLPVTNNLLGSKDAKIFPSTILEPQLITDEPGIEVWLTHKTNNRKQKGRIDVLLNSKLGVSSVENYILSKLFVRVLKSQNFSLIDRAHQAGIGLKFDYNYSGFVISLRELTEKHSLLMQQVMTQLKDWNVEPADFNNARNSMRQKLNNREKSPAIMQSFELLSSQLRPITWTRKEEKAAIEKVNLKSLLAFKQQLFSKNKLRVFAYGNYSEDTANAIVTEVKKALPDDRKRQLVRFEPTFFTPVGGKRISLEKTTSGHTDNALVEYFVTPKQSVAGMAQTRTLAALMKNSFFTQLRTNEQLGYRVGITPQRLNDFTSFMFFVQSNNTAPPRIKERIDRFRVEFLTELEQTSTLMIDQVKQSERDVLAKEKSRYLFSDFYKGKVELDSRQKLIDAFDEVDKESLIDFYKAIILEQKGTEILIQVKGKQFFETNFAQ